MISPNMIGPKRHTTQHLRMAALRLHGLHPSDQRWVLSQLPHRDQPALRLLLDDLRHLGFPPDAATSPLVNLPRVAAAGVLEIDPAVAARIDQAPLAGIQKLLTQQGDVTRAFIFHARSWSWTGEAWSQLTLREQARTIHCIAQMRPQHAPLMLALLDCFAQALDASGDRDAPYRGLQGVGVA